MAEKDKVTVRLTPDVLNDIRTAVENGGTVTGYVQEAVEQRVSRERRARGVWNSWGPFTDEELQFARGLLDGDQRQQQPAEPGEAARYRAAS